MKTVATLAEVVEELRNDLERLAELDVISIGQQELRMLLDVAEENARLRAVSSDLLAALERLVNPGSGMGFGGADRMLYIENARAAIKKAKDET